MMSKRAAEVQLTQDNVDEQYDASEEAGQFEVASEEQLKQRVIKKAKRTGRVPGDGGNSGGIFAGLRTSQPLTIGKESLSPTLFPPSGLAPVINPPPKQSTPYLVQLKSLNESVSEWIGKHVKTNPYVDLTPIFNDYTTHLAAIETKYKHVDDEDSQGSESREKETDTEATEDSQTTDSAPSVSESQEESSVQCEEASSQSGGDEDNCLMTVRAKLFYKKGSEYTELGVGTLKVQPSSSKAVGLLLRNDTSLSKVLLNVRVTSDIPVSSKNNNVFLVCVPNPPLSKDNDTPVSYLIRVKTSQLADKLMTTLKENTN